MSSDRDALLNPLSANPTKWSNTVNPLNANPTKWSNTVTQLVGCCRRIVFWVCLTILWGLALKGLKSETFCKNGSIIVCWQHPKFANQIAKIQIRFLSKGSIKMGGGETLPVYSNHVHTGRPNTKINKVSSKNSI